MHKIIFFYLTLILFSLNANAQDTSLYSQKEVIYGRKDGMALTMFVTNPKGRNINRAIIFIASAGYHSSADMAKWMTNLCVEYLKRGYTVFVVVHSSSPGYSANQAVVDIQKSIQFIRYHAKDNSVDPDKIGVTGASSGGNLALLMGTLEAKSNDKSVDPTANVSSKANAVACFFPGTDLINFRKANQLFTEDSTIAAFFEKTSVFDFKELNPALEKYDLVTDANRKRAILKAMSPMYSADKTTAPTLVYHGDKDTICPITQSIMYIKKLESLNVPSKLLIKKGAGHVWDGCFADDTKALADWFDVYLK